MLVSLRQDASAICRVAPQVSSFQFLVYYVARKSVSDLLTAIFRSLCSAPRSRPRDDFPISGGKAGLAVAFELIPSWNTRALSGTVYGSHGQIRSESASLNAAHELGSTGNGRSRGTSPWQMTR